MINLALFALGIALQIAAAAPAPNSQSPQARSEDGRSTTNCGNRIRAQISEVNRYTFRVTASASRPSLITVGAMTTCIASTWCSGQQNYSALAAGENEITVTFSDGTCGDAAISTWIDK